MNEAITASYIED